MRDQSGMSGEVEERIGRVLVITLRATDHRCPPTSKVPESIVRRNCAPYWNRTVRPVMDTNSARVMNDWTERVLRAAASSKGRSARCSAR